MKKLYYLGAFITFIGTIVFCICLVNHVENPALAPFDLLGSAVITRLGALIMREKKNNEIVLASTFIK